MSRIVDLTLPIIKHWRYPIKYELVKSHARGDLWQATSYNLQSHWFTHIDAPIHHDPDGDTLDAYPIDDWCISDCLILDFTSVPDNTAITSKMLEEANKEYADKHYDSLILRTDRGKKVSWKEYEFWDNSPWVSEDGGEWIKNYAPKVVGYDFPQDYEIRKIRTAKPGEPIHQPVHDHVLKEGRILQIEYLTNLWEVKVPVCKLIALPLNTQKADGTQIRVIAVVDD
jgi:arylformamidase